MDRTWTFAIDRGGTFTDVVARSSDGRLRVEATPLARGRTTQLWQVAVSDERGRLVAHGEVRLMHLDGQEPAPPA